MNGTCGLDSSTVPTTSLFEEFHRGYIGGCPGLGK